MRRFVTALCVVALLCQIFVFPAAAVEKADPTTGTTTAPSADQQNKTIRDEYMTYLEKYGDTIASKEIVLKADKATSLLEADLEGEALQMYGEGSAAQYTVTIPESAWYTLALVYSGKEGTSSADIELGLQINGKYPYEMASRFVLPRTWINDYTWLEDDDEKNDDQKFRADKLGNEFAPEQKEDYTPNWEYPYAMRDVNGFVSEDLRIYLEAGENVLTLECFGEAFQLYEVHLTIPEVLPTLAEMKAKWEKEGAYYTGKEQILLEAEGTHDKENLNDIVSKTDRSVIGLSDNSDVGVQPSDAVFQKVNYIGGSNWSMPDEAITWTVDAPEAGVYKMAVHYRQNYLINATSYRNLKVNGKHQYAEQASLAFDYNNGWKFTDELLDGETVLVYLDKGVNTITMSVTLGEMDEYSSKMEDLILRLGNMYRDIISIVGENPDSNRDYDLFQRIDTLEEDMTGMYKEIEVMIDERTDEDGNIDDIAALLKKMNVVLDKMLTKQYEAQIYKGNYYDNYSGLAAQLQEMKNMALDIDCITFAAVDAKYERTTGNFIEQLGFEVKRFIASFFNDYNTAAGADGEDMTNLTIWVNWSRDQTLVLNSLINSKFSSNPEYDDISVTIRMTNASLLQGIMSGNGPDCSLSDARVTPVNLAMRGALVDLSKMEGYDELFYQPGQTYDGTASFAAGADKPYEYNGGVYGLPSTQQFYMLFYRTDIFEKYGLVDEKGEAKAPKTWDEFLEYASILMMNNMQVGLPFVELKDIGQTNGGVASLNIFPTLLMQQDLSLYNKEMNGTSFNETETMRVFQEWTDYYTKYNLPKEYNFFNRFRIGLVPMAVQSYGQYSALSAAAPEIKGKWAMAEIPGTPVVDENGNPVLDENGNQVINNKQAGFGSACMILELSENKEAAWKLLKWWMSQETQTSYALDIESILGVAGRYTSANVDATLSLDWGKGANKILESQWYDVEEVAEIPGGYYVSRAVDQAFWNVLSMSENPKDMMKKWGEIADAEIAFKINQYKDDVKEDAGK